MEAVIRRDERVLGDFLASLLTSFVSCENHPTPRVHNNLQRAGLDGGDLPYVIVVVKIHNLQYKNQFAMKKELTETVSQCDCVDVD